MAPEHLPRVFDRFYRAEAARTRSEAGGGTGLGLSIARDLARAQGGDLTAANSPEGGARFTLKLPDWCLIPPKTRMEYERTWNTGKLGTRSFGDAEPARARSPRGKGVRWSE